MLFVAICFFRAEDGIRDGHVTGVQTCALPIYRQVDKQMTRTINRPVATGRVDPWHAGLFALTLGLIGMSLLVLFINTLTAVLTLISLLGYAVVYTLLLKRATPQNIVIDGIEDEASNILRWTVVKMDIHVNTLLMV